jgi:hypothetical protein
MTEREERTMLETLERLFTEHAPETLMAFFGAATSMILLYLVLVMLRHLFGLETRSAAQDAEQGQATAVLVEALVGALVSEAGHLRHTLDGLLKESLRRSEQNTEILASVLASTDRTPQDVLALLTPEFDRLRQQVRQAEARIVAKVIEAARSQLTSEGEHVRLEGKAEDEQSGADLVDGEIHNAPVQGDERF